METGRQVFSVDLLERYAAKGHGVITCMAAGNDVIVLGTSKGWIIRHDFGVGDSYVAEVVLCADFMEDDSALLRFLQCKFGKGRLSGPEFFYDPKYALRLCLKEKRMRACIHIYSMMPMHEEAVALALQVDPELAKAETDKVEDDEDLRKKLWLMVAKHVVEQEKGTKRENIRKAIAFLKETDGAKIEDILPFFPDFALIDDFKEAICSSLEDYNKQIEQLKQEMNDATHGADNIRNDISALAQRYAVIDCDEDCGVCQRKILTAGWDHRMARGYTSVGAMAPFYVFPCGHAFHAQCLIAHVTRCTHRDQIRSQLDDVIACECPFCGDLMIREISLPLILPGEAYEAASWEIRPHNIGAQKSLSLARKSSHRYRTGRYSATQEANTTKFGPEPTHRYRTRHFLDPDGAPFTFTFPQQIFREIPSTISALAPKLIYLELGHNYFTGQIPDFLGSFHALDTLDLSWNRFSGTVPKSFGNLTKICNLDLSHNFLVDPFPEMNVKASGDLFYDYIDLSDNEILGSPVGLLNRTNYLVGFRASGNRIRFDMETVKFPNTLKDLDLSRNLVFGKLPKAISGLEKLNVSNNHLCGPIPPNKFPASAFSDNDCLCGSPLSPCKA
ncbi:Vacuolar sorting protein 18 [Camellia lanceoleosa]|uniref:Vacuolar sorting protein 18 n=1 Tax=Camellia lanceoleosa TaxID=1840588 RepID=A0ACC0GV10_9ERIC|nr:Vacuolar sorting protein 18 [Camellia lanceoleosa]